MSIPPELHSRIRTAVLLVAGALFVGILAELLPYGKMLYCILTIFVAGSAFHEYGNVALQKKRVFIFRGEYFWRGGALVFPLFLTSLSHFICHREQFLANQFLITPANALLFSLIGFVGAVFYSSLMVVMLGRSNKLIAVEIAKDVPLASLVFGCGLNSLAILLLIPGGFKTLLFGLLIVCISDSAAYFGGKKFQGVKLAPALSPNKTVSGATCGLLSGTIIASIAGVLLLSLPVWVGIIIGSLVALVGQGGDLIKSYLKRLHGVKDFGTFLPGHGGALDRLDGILSVAPLLLLLTYWVFEHMSTGNP